MERLCQLGLVSRAGFYAAGRILRRRRTRTSICATRFSPRIAQLEFPYYGWGRITAELEKRGCPTITSACTGSCARTICFACGEGSLLWSPRTRTTPARYIRIWHAAWRWKPESTSWVADITPSGWSWSSFYLAVILVLFAARDWLGARPDAENRLTIAALQMAFDNRSPAPCRSCVILTAASSTLPETTPIC